MARGNGFEIKILSDTQQFERGIRDGIIDPLDDADAALEQLGDAAADAGRDAGRGLDKIGDEAKDAGRDVDRLADEAKDAGREIENAGRDGARALDKLGREADDTERAVKDVGDAAEDAGRDGERGAERLERALREAQRQAGKTEDAVDDIGTTGRGGMGRLGEAASEVTQEIGQNLGEAVSSVRGNLSDLGQVGQDTLGGLAATLAGTGGTAGIVGAAALAAGATGLGLITAQLEKQEEQAKQLKEYLSDAWQSAIESGQEYIGTTSIIGEMNDLMFNPERAAENNQLLKDAKTLHLDAAVLRRAAAGDQESLNAVLLETARYQDDAKSTNAILYGQARDINNRWKDRSAIFDEYKRKAADAERATYDYVTSVGVATGETDDLGNAIYRLPDNTEVVVNANTRKANTDVDAFERNVQGVKGKSVTVTANGRVNMSGATAGLNRWISQNNGRTVKVNGRYVSPPGSDIP